MKVNYDPDVDILRIIFKDTPIEESDEEKPGLIVDFDQEGNVIGLEILNASRQIDNPQSIEYAISRQAKGL